MKINKKTNKSIKIASIIEIVAILRENINIIKIIIKYLLYVLKKPYL